jgi:phenol hydroxylase P1 protein
MALLLQCQKAALHAISITSAFPHEERASRARRLGRSLTAAERRRHVEYELRQQVVEPRRKTFQNLIERYGDKPASRYDEATVDVQPTENFHYRPLWGPDKELYDESYTALRLEDPYNFKDPRQYYYAPYVTARAALHDAFGKTLDYVGQRELLGRLPEAWQELIATVVVPLRHYESGAQLLSVNGARFAYGTSIEQCLTYAAFDRIGNAQMLTRVGIALAGGSADLLGGAKQAWMVQDSLQGLRRYVEELLVEDDWATQMIGIDLTDRLLYPMLYRHLDELALMSGAGAYSLVAQHFAAWFTDHRRWIDALLVSWTEDVAHGDANAAHLGEVVHEWLPRAHKAATLVADAVSGLVGGGVHDALALSLADVRSSFENLGVIVAES